MMRASRAWSDVPLKGLWLTFGLTMHFNIRFCSADCLSTEAHLNCFSKDLLQIEGWCTGSGSVQHTQCLDIFPKETELAVPKEWISAKHVGAWYAVFRSKAFSMTKIIVQQRSAEFSQINEVSIEFDTAPSLQMTLTQNVNATLPPVFDQLTFPSRRSKMVNITVLSTHTDSSEYLGLRRIEIYDENCDRDYQEMNIEHRSLSTDPSVVRSWSPFTGALKTFLSFDKTLTFYLAATPSVMSDSYQVHIDIVLKKLSVYRLTDEGRVLMKDQSIYYEFTKRQILWFHLKDSKVIIGDRTGVRMPLVDEKPLKVRYWGIACSSHEPVQLMYWKHIGKCYENADYYWLADKLLGGKTIAELRQGKDGQILDFEEAEVLPYGPLIDGHTSSALYFSGAYSGGAYLGQFNNGCFSDLTACTGGYTVALWMSILDSDDSSKRALRMSQIGLHLACKSGTVKILIRIQAREYTTSIQVRSSTWNHVFIFWDPVKGVTALVNNRDEYTGSVGSQGAFNRVGYTDFRVGSIPGSQTHSSRMAIRDIALWERRLSLVEAHEHCHCNNFEIPKEFAANRRVPLTGGAFPFPGQNIARHDCSFKDGSTCDEAIDGSVNTFSYKGGKMITIVLTFDRAYIVNKVSIYGVNLTSFTMKFKDGSSEQFKINVVATLPRKLQEMNFKDKVTDSIELVGQGDGPSTGIYEVRVFYDFSKDRLPSTTINWALGCRVSQLGSSILTPLITDGSTSDDGITIVDTTASTPAAAPPPAGGSSDLSSNWIQIDLARKVKVNLIRLWLVNNITAYDHLKTFILEFSSGDHTQFRMLFDEETKTYWSEFVFEPQETHWINIHILDTYGTTNGKIGIKEVELFYDTSKDLPASKTIIDEKSVRTWEKGLSTAKFGVFDFLLTVDVKMSQPIMSILGRRTTLGSLRPLLRTNSDHTLYVRFRVHDLYSKSAIADGVWHNVKLFYNAKECILSLFIDNRLEFTLTVLVAKENDGWDWEEGKTLDSDFNGTLKNFRIHQAVRGFGMETRKIPDSALSVTSASSNLTGAVKARLNGQGAWIVAAEDTIEYEYLQVDLGIASHITYVAFQGLGDKWVTWARISYSMDSIDWTFLLDINQQPQIFRASHDNESVAMVMLYSPVVARYIRIHPYLANVGMALRTEVYGHDYGLPFNTMLSQHVPSYRGCVKLDDLLKLHVSSPSSGFKSLVSTPDDCKHACALEDYMLAALFQGVVCLCTEKSTSFQPVSDEHCSFPCPGNPVLRCGGETTVSLYDSVEPSTSCADCTVGIFSEPFLKMFGKIEIFTNSSGDAVSYIDVSVNGVHIGNLTSGTLEHRFVTGGQMHLVAEARDALGQQVAVASRTVNVQYQVISMGFNCPEWVRKGETYKCSMYAYQGSGTNLDCSIDGERLPMDFDDNMLITTGDIIPEYPASTLGNNSIINDNSSIILPAQLVFSNGILIAYEFLTTCPGSVTIQIFRPLCTERKWYCLTTLSCVNAMWECRNGVYYPTTAHTFPSTGKICSSLDTYCPTRELPSNLTTGKLIAEETLQVADAGLHVVYSSKSIWVKPGDYLGYTGTAILQHKSTGVSFRAEETSNGEFSPVARIAGTTAMLRVHYWRNRRLDFDMNKTGKLNCTLYNDVATNTISTYINSYEEVKDVVLTFPNVSATNESVLFAVAPHPGGDVSYTFRFHEKEPILLENRNSSQILTFNYTFAESGYFQVNLTVRNVKSSFNISALIQIVDAIKELAWPSLLYVRVDELTNISWSAKFGEQVTLNFQFGDGLSATVGPLDLGSGPENTVLHSYKSVGTYTTCLVAENAVSAVSLTGPIVVMEPICNVTVTIETEFALTEEPVVVSASVTNGTDVEYLVVFTCKETGISLPEEQFSGVKLTTSFTEACVYDYHVLAYNNVSSESFNGSLIVEDPMIVNLRATVGLSVAGEPTVLTAAVDKGGVVHCSWDFGEGAIKTLPFKVPAEHVYPSGGKYVVNLNCSNKLRSANTSLDVEVLVYITQMDITTLPGLGPREDNFPLEKPLVFNFATNCIFVNFSVNFGDSSTPIVTQATWREHVFPSAGSYYVTVNVSNAISFKIATMSVTVLESVKDIVVETNGPMKLAKEMIFEVTIGQIGTSACYYFNLGDGTEFIYQVDSLTTCTADYKHVTDTRVMASSKISFGHTYTELSVYQVTCTGSNLVSSVVAKAEAVIVQAPCSQPVVSIEGLTQSVDDPREFMRSEEFEVMSKNTIDCEATSETDFDWKVFKVTAEGFSEEESVEVVLSDIKTDEWKIIFKSRSLDYGLYYISFTLNMVGVEGVSSSTFGYIKIIPSPIVAEVRGGSTRVFGFNKMILLDGGMSRDPDVEEGDYEGMTFYWHCKRSDDNYTFPAEPEPIKSPMKVNTTNSTMDYGGCFGHGPGRLNYSDTTWALDLDTGLMRENISYFLQLLVKKDLRRSVFELFIEIIPGDPPTVGLTCLRNCLIKFNPTVKVSLEATCEDCKNSVNMKYQWEVYLYTAGSWDLLDNTGDIILTRPSSPNLVIKEESLLGNRTYKIRVQVWRPGGVPGVAELVRTVNVPPFGGWCFASPQAGFALDTLFSVTCGDWIDDNLPLKYTFSYFPGSGTLESLVYVGENSFSPNVTFPTGQDDNYTLWFVVLVTDSLDASTLVQLKVQVKPTNTDALISKVEDMAAGNGTLNTLISSGDTQNALQMISAVGNMLNFESEKDGNTDPADAAKNSTGGPQEETSNTKAQEENTKLRTSLVTVISTAPVETLEDAQRTSSVLGTVTKETEEVSAEAQNTATSTLETVGNVLESAATKPGTHPRTVAKTAEAVLSGLGNVIQAAFFIEEPAPQKPKIDEQIESNDADQKTETPTEKPSSSAEDEEEKQEKQRKKELANKLMTVVKTVAKAVMTNKAPGETPTRIETPYLSLEAYRESPEELSMKVLSARSGSFALPQMGSILNGSGTVDVSTVATPTNPFEDEAKRINSVVMTTEIRNASGGISISNLDEPIDIRLPRDPKPVPSGSLYQATAGKMIFHKFDVTHNDSSINIDLHLVGNCSERANFSLYLQKDRKPSVLKHMFNATIPDLQPMTQNNASKNPSTFFISNVDLKRAAKGRFYVGVMYNRPDSECPDFMNYTLDIFTSGCLYWDEEVNVWKGDGCTVGFLTSRNETQCLCTHLTSFGGDFVVPPNSIDWSAVTAGFSNLDQNPVVFAVVVSIIALYFILLLWVRRLDKNDLNEFVTIPLPDNDSRDDYNYQVVVYTGHQKNCGTTAKVFIIISGNLDETEPRALLDLTNTSLKPGGVDTFILSVPSSLGKLDHIRVWHDNNGDSPSWYLNRILVHDVQTDRKSWFLCDQWLAVEEEDGLIDRMLPAATKDDLVSFNFLFSIEARRKLSEEHLWFSVLARRPRNQFTRLQRLSCCFALLLSTMLANAMFYQTGDDTSSSGNQVQAGPLAFSLKQVWIGFISCLVVLPVNLLVVYIFRNVKPKDYEGSSDGGKDSGRAQKYAPTEEEPATEVLSDPTENLMSCSKLSLPRKSIYVAYVLLFLTISVSATFTIFYGFTFGKEKSEKWISSTLFSFFQDLMLIQPLKVFAAATFIALVIKDPDKVDQGDKCESKPEAIEKIEDQSAGDEEQFVISNDYFREPTSPRMVVKPPAEAELVAVRELRTKQKKMRRIISEVCWYIAYLVLISIVAYGNRDPKAYLVTKTMNDMFVENKYAARLRLNDISNIDQYWSWLYNSILPGINPPYWYGPYGLDDIETISKSMASKSRAKAKSKTSKTKLSGSSGADDLGEIYHSYPKRFTADRGVSYVVGLARARQLRNAPQDACVVHPTVRHLHHQCSAEYSWSNEDKGCYNVSWSTYNGSEHNCEQMNAGRSPWSYHSAWDLKGTPFWGQFNNYWGGGYVWNLDSSLSVIQNESKQLKAQSWFDEQTQAVFFEFTVYNAFTNFFCSVTLLVEKHITGTIHPYTQLHTLRLYHYVGAEAIVTLVCEIIFVGVLCYLFSRELKEARSGGIKNYFKDPWNYFDVLGLVFSFTAIGLYFARMAATSLALKQINENQNVFVSFHYVSAIDQSFTTLLALAVFVYSLKVLRLLRFNRRISLLSTTLIACTHTLVGFLFTYILLFAAYAQVLYLVYGKDLPEYSTFQRCLSSLMEMTLGSSDFDGMNATNRILTAFVFFSYTLLNTCVYMNLFISILSETFSTVRADVLLQPNDHEIVDFMMKTVRKAVFRAVEPMTDPIYKEPKDRIDIGVDKIAETSECIQGALQVLSKEDVRQSLWFGDQSKLREKRVLFTILLESGEIFTENDIGDAVPLLDDILRKSTMEDLVMVRDNQRRKIASDLAKSLRGNRRRSRFSQTESWGRYSSDEEGGSYGSCDGNVSDSMETNGSWDYDGRSIFGGHENGDAYKDGVFYNDHNNSNNSDGGYSDGVGGEENVKCWSRTGDVYDDDVYDDGNLKDDRDNSDGGYSDRDDDDDDDEENVKCRSRTGDGNDGDVYGNSSLKDEHYNSDGGYSDRDDDRDDDDDGSDRDDDDGDDNSGDDVCHGGASHGGDNGDDHNDKLGDSNHDLRDGDSDDDNNGTRSGDQSDDGGGQSETDHEDNPTLDQQDDDTHGSGQPVDTENYESDSPLSPRSDSCVITMETGTEE